ncbi:MAG: type IV conjugative transfer system protein TraL [Deltaproteobacteria bacterium]|nr:type IV conjugative transfer system protein TraL [Deltaproteobacteria bacterium]
MYKRIPKYIGAEPTVLFWELTEFLIFMSFFGAGIILGEMLIFVALGGIASYAYAKSKDKLVKGYFLHLLYWHGLYKTKKVIPYHIREVIR